MPGPRHDAANELIRQRPDLVVHLLRTVGEADLPNDAMLRVHSGELNDRISTNRYADTLILAGPPQDPGYGVVCEIETQMTQEKVRQTLRHAVTVWLQLDKPVHVVFVTPDRGADRFAGPVTVTAGGLRLELHPCVCGPNQIPVITDPRQVAADPALAALSVMQHGRREEVGKAFIAGLRTLTSDDTPRYYEYAYDMAEPQAKRILEALMATTDWPVHSPFAKQHFGRGKAEGMAAGKAEGKAGAVVAVLLSRGLVVTADQRKIIENTTDQALLDDWIKKVAMVESTEKLLAAEPSDF
jgi:hypothetical protein